ncbi:MAG: hypothetical protein D6722_06355 [Bacteroidetes bacterium]|nr:MAG: hypothetical protein D6722_06355 [Bacteroidota bacterium]
MRTILLATILLIGSGGGNDLLRRAGEAYAAGDYSQSLSLYRQLQQMSPIMSPEVAFNLGQCYRHLDSVDLALYAYQRAMQGGDAIIGSQAANETGVLLTQRTQLKDALAAFRQALVMNPHNETARFNYELLYQRLFPPEEDTPPLPPESEPPPESPEQEPPPLQDQALQELVERLQQQSETREMGTDRARSRTGDTLNPAQAQQALERLRQSELQYLQQLRKRVTSVPQGSRKRDW